MPEAKKQIEEDVVEVELESDTEKKRRKHPSICRGRK